MRFLRRPDGIVIPWSDILAEAHKEDFVEVPQDEADKIVEDLRRRFGTKVELKTPTAPPEPPSPPPVKTEEEPKQKPADSVKPPWKTEKQKK